MKEHRFFFSYLFDRIKQGAPYHAWKNLLTYLRRFRTVTLILRITTFLFALLQTGTLVVISTAIFLVILPILTAVMLGILLTALLESRRTNLTMQKELQRKQVCILFAESECSPFFIANARELASRGYAVIVISPRLISPIGLKKGKFYTTARQEFDRIWVIRRYYFFSFKKNVLSDKRTIYMY